jgi:hypothetical protein
MHNFDRIHDGEPEHSASQVSEIPCVVEAKVSEAEDEQIRIRTIASNEQQSLPGNESQQVDQ